jgi:hypothetical protein
MKRSEMVDHIVFFIELHNDNDPSWLEHPEAQKAKEKAFDVASKLLNDIEELGMLPPTIRIPAFGVTDNAWEPENE